MSTRVALLHNIVSPHVVPLFARLATEPSIDLKVYFLAETDLNRRWAADIGTSFAYEVLPNWAIRVGRGDLYTFFVNPTILARLLRDRFDVLISVGWDSFAALAGFALCMLLRRPFVIWAGSTVYEPSWRRTLTLPLVKLVVGGSSGWIAYGSRARDYLVRLGADPTRVEVAYNTVDVEWFKARASELRPRRDALRRDLGLSPGPVVLYVGQLIERKGALDLLAAHELLARRRPDAQLLIVGYGPLERALRDQVAARGIPGVVFAGHVPLAALPRYYVAADCFVLPSHEEVWGLVLNEAAACGLPLVTTEPVGAGPDLVEEGANGFIVPVGRPDELCAALLRALSRASEMGQHSRNVVARATFDQNVAAVARAIRAATAQAPSSLST